MQITDISDLSLRSASNSVRIMKVFIGTLNIGNNGLQIKQGFKEIGIDASVGLVGTDYIYDYSSIDFDLTELYKEGLKKVNIGEDPKELLFESRWKELLDFDIYLFISSHTLLPGALDLPILRHLKKIIISYFPGSDTRYGKHGKEFNRFYGHSFSEDLAQDITTYDATIFQVSKRPRFQDSFVNKLHNIRMAEKYAHMIMSNPCANVLAIRPYMGLVIPFDPENHPPNIPGRDVPVVVHAPTNVLFKRSDIIINAAFEAWAKGSAFELKLLRNVSNTRVKEALHDCDILIDQIACGKTGLLGLEGLTMGCVVLGCNDFGAMPIPNVHSPVIRIDERNIATTLERVVREKETRIELAKAGLDYVNKGFHKAASIAQYIMDSLSRSLEGDFDYYPQQFFENPDPPSHEHMPKYLMNLTVEIMEEYGVNNTASIARLKENNQISSIPTASEWDTSKMAKHPWGFQSANAIFPLKPDDAPEKRGKNWSADYQLAPI